MRKVSFAYIRIVLICGLFVSSSLRAEDSPQRHAPNLLPGVEPAMLTPDYWITLQDDPDNVIMTSREIAQFNENVRNKKLVFREHFGKSDPLEKPMTELTGRNLLMNPVLPLELPGTLSGDILKGWLAFNLDQLYHPHKLWGSADYFDDRNVIWNEAMKKEVADAMNMDSISKTIKRRYGIIVNRADMRYFPTAVPGYRSVAGRTDRFQGGALYTGMPVAVLHESADGNFLFVESPVSRGWVDALDIALGSREEIRGITGSEQFLMAAAEKVPVYGDESYRNFACYLYLSSTMPLKSYGNSGYEVNMPYRKPDGSVGIAGGYIKQDADVYLGHMPFTKRNVLTQAFKMLNQPYGWEDQDNKRDCCGTMWALLRCFGITTGRVPRYILNGSDDKVYIDPGLSTDEKMIEVAKIEPVITMAGTAGHIVLYLGKAHNGMLYFFHQAGWGYKDENGDMLEVRRMTVNAADHSWYGINSPRVFTTFRMMQSSE